MKQNESFGWLSYKLISILITHFIVSYRCSCKQCSDAVLVSAREYRCCREVDCARGKLTFDGSIERISCVTGHEDNLALTNQTVLNLVAPLLRDKNGRAYRGKMALHKMSKYIVMLKKLSTQYKTSRDLLYTKINQIQGENSHRRDIFQEVVPPYPKFTSVLVVALKQWVVSKNGNNHLLGRNVFDLSSTYFI